MNAPASRRGRTPRNAQADDAKPLNISPRLAEQRAARQARGSNDQTAALKLGVDESKLDTENFVYRFANEEEGGSRLRFLTKQKDYEIVSNSDLSEPTEDLGDAVTRTIGSLKDGSPNRAVLLRKPRDWYEEDKAKDRKPDRDAMEAIKRGSPSSRGAGGAVLTAQDPSAYIPEEGISVSTARPPGFEP